MEGNHSGILFSLFGPDPHTYHINVRAGINTKAKVTIHNHRLRKQLEQAVHRKAIVRAPGRKDLSKYPLGAFLFLFLFETLLLSGRLPRSGVKRPG